MRCSHLASILLAVSSVPALGEGLTFWRFEQSATISDSVSEDEPFRFTSRFVRFFPDTGMVWLRSRLAGQRGATFTVYMGAAARDTFMAMAHDSRGRAYAADDWFVLISDLKLGQGVDPRSLHVEVTNTGMVSALFDSAHTMESAKESVDALVVLAKPDDELDYAMVGKQYASLRATWADTLYTAGSLVRDSLEALLWDPKLRPVPDGELVMAGGVDSLVSVPVGDYRQMGDPAPGPLRMLTLSDSVRILLAASSGGDSGQLYRFEGVAPDTLFIVDPGGDDAISGQVMMLLLWLSVTMFAASY